jgi:hypothetical protein
MEEAHHPPPEDDPVSWPLRPGRNHRSPFAIEVADEKAKPNLGWKREAEWTEIHLRFRWALTWALLASFLVHLLAGVVLTCQSDPPLSAVNGVSAAGRRTSLPRSAAFEPKV